MGETATRPRAEDVLAILRANEAELRAAGIRRVSLFGSVARCGADSDIDLAVQLGRNPLIGFWASWAWKSGCPNCLGVGWT
jgi:predicted nucleotidyltransferase